MENKYPLLHQEEPFDKADLDQVLRQLCEATVRANDLTLVIGDEAADESNTLFDLIFSFTYRYVGREIPKEFLSTHPTEDDSKWFY